LKPFFKELLLAKRQKNYLCKVLRRRAWDRDRDETWDLRDRDSKKRVSRHVSRPRPSLETPSLQIS